MKKWLCIMSLTALTSMPLVAADALMGDFDMDPAEFQDLIAQLRESMPEDMRSEFESAISEQNEQARRVQELEEELAAADTEINDLRSDKKELVEALNVLSSATLDEDGGRSQADIDAEKEELQAKLDAIKAAKKSKKQSKQEIEERRKQLDAEVEKKMAEQSKAFEAQTQAMDGDVWGDDDDSDIIAPVAQKAVPAVKASAVPAIEEEGDVAVDALDADDSDDADEKEEEDKE